MTVSTTTNKKQYAGLLGQDTFAYDFRVDAKADMEVYIDAVLEASGNWTIDNLGNPAGGDVILNTPLVADASVVLLRNVAQTQGVDYQPLDAFPAETHEAALDKLTFLVQQVTEVLSRTPSLGVDTALTDFSLGSPIASAVVQYNSAADGIESSGIDATSFNADVAAAAASAADAAASAASIGVSSGAWTPHVVDNSLNPSEGQTYVSATGWYIKLSDLCFFGGYFQMSSLGGLTGAHGVGIGGIPFIPHNTSDPAGFAVFVDGGGLNMATLVNPLVGYISGNPGWISVKNWEGSTLSPDSMTLDELSADGYLRFAGIYKTT